MKILNYIQFNEDVDSDESTQDKYSDAKDEIKEMIENSLKTSDKATIEDFTQAFLKNSEDTKIEGLINDSDIYDFYLKHRNDVDEILLDIKFYDDIPSEMNVFGVYDYVIKATNKAISELVNMISV